VNEDFAEAVSSEEATPGASAPEETAAEEAVSAPDGKPEPSPGGKYSLVKQTGRLVNSGILFLLPGLRALRAAGQALLAAGRVLLVAGRALRRFFKKDSAPNLVLVTALLAVAASAAVSLAHTVTEPRIEARQAEAYASAMGTVFSGEDLRFTQSSLAENIYEGRNEEGRLVGFSVLVSARGRAGTVRMVVGISTAREVTGVTVVSHRELGDLTEIKKRGAEDALASLGGGMLP